MRTAFIKLGFIARLCADYAACAAMKQLKLSAMSG
jgi:hypothetical protein